MNEALQALDLTASGTLFAVGVNGVYRNPAGGGWTALPSPTPGNSAFHDLVAVADNEVYIAGHTWMPFAAIVARFDGSGWTIADLAAFDAIALTRAGSTLYAVATATGPTSSSVFRLNGSTWEATAVTTFEVNDAWGSASGQVVLVGNGGEILRGSGATFSPMTSGTTEDLRAVWGRADDDIFAVGATTLLHFDGIAWNPVDLGLGTTTLGAIGGDATHMFVSARDDQQRALLLHHVDGEWVTDALNESDQMTAIEATAGGFVAGDAGGDLYRTDPTGWRQHHRAVSSSFPRAATMLGPTTTLIGLANGEVGTLTNTGWSTTSISADRIEALHAVSPSDIYAATWGNLMHYDGTQWSPVSTPARASTGSSGIARGSGSRCSR